MFVPRLDDPLVFKVGRTLSGVAGTKTCPWPKDTGIGPQGLASDGRNFYLGFIRGLKYTDRPDMVGKLTMAGEFATPQKEFELPPFCRHTNHLEVRGDELIAMTWNNDIDYLSLGFDGIHPDSVWRISLSHSGKFSETPLSDYGRADGWHIQTAHWDEPNFVVCVVNETRKRFRLVTYDSDGVLIRTTSDAGLPGTIQGAIYQKGAFICLSENGVSVYAVESNGLTFRRTESLMPQPGNVMKSIEPEGLTIAGDTIYYLLETTDHDDPRPTYEECQVYKFRMPFSELNR